MEGEGIGAAGEVRAGTERATLERVVRAGPGEGVAPLAGVGRRAEAVHRTVHGELGGPQALHHVAATGLTGLLEGRQNTVDRGETALDALGGDRAPGDHPVRSSRVRASAWARTVGSLSRSGSSDQRPATVGGPVREAPRAAAVSEP
ncbi:hypothetical protein SHIRM173S_10157 [Streptomyces hirsutus]